MESRDFSNRAEPRFLWFFGLLVLLLGAFVYVLARGGNAYFVPEFIRGLQAENVMRHLTNQLPTFFHTFAFATFMAAIWSSSKRTVLLACSGVVVMEVFLELGQHTSVAQHVATNFPTLLDDVPIIGLMPEYFTRGTYDLWDILSILVGGAISVVAGLCIYTRRE